MPTAAPPCPRPRGGHGDPSGPFLDWAYVIMFLCNSILPSFAPRGAPSRASANQIGAANRKYLADTHGTSRPDVRRRGTRASRNRGSGSGHARAHPRDRSHTQTTDEAPRTACKTTAETCFTRVKKIVHPVHGSRASSDLHAPFSIRTAPSAWVEGLQRGQTWQSRKVVQAAREMVGAAQQVQDGVVVIVSTNLHPPRKV